MIQQTGNTPALIAASLGNVPMLQECASRRIHLDTKNQARIRMNLVDTIAVFISLVD
jgi:hypothetical protein